MELHLTALSTFIENVVSWHCKVFWERYIRYLEETEGLESASRALTRAQGIHCKRRPEIFLFAARYYEAHGDLDGARQAFTQILQQLSPGSIEATIAKANFERRQVRAH